MLVLSVLNGSTGRIKMEDRYLGDGVYASYDGYYIRLDLRGQDHTTKIALDSKVMYALNQFNIDIITETKDGD